MTALPIGVLDPIRRFHQIPVETINAALDQHDPKDLDGGYDCRQSREGEDTDRISIEAQIRALACHPGFWRVASQLPDNTIYWPVRHNADGTTTPAHLPKGTPRPGAPVHYPGYLMLFAACIAQPQDTAPTAPHSPTCPTRATGLAWSTSSISTSPKNGLG